MTTTPLDVTAEVTSDATSGATEVVRSALLASLDQRYRCLRLPAPRARRAALAASLDRHGQRHPLLVTDGVGRDRLVLLDGFKRAELLIERGVLRALVRVESLDTPTSLAMIIAANVRGRGPTELEEAWVIDALRREHGLTQEQVGALLSRHKSWVCRREKLITQLERAVQDDVRIGIVSATTAREIARLPRGNQAAVAQAIARHGLSSREAGRLVGVLLCVSPERRRDVLADPAPHIAAAAAEGDGLPRPDPRLGATGNRVRQQLLRLQSAANRLGELFLERPPASYVGQPRRVLGGLAGPIVARTRRVLEQVTELVDATDDSEATSAACEVAHAR